MRNGHGSGMGTQDVKEQGRHDISRQSANIGGRAKGQVVMGGSAVGGYEEDCGSSTWPTSIE